ncbi:hypothetical protein Q8A67_022171 [Cirrhinus molitorella]|uniref:Uncharacterized protein n=1 Tax=Cirrhinus molitorella TaxID=172907 RepID=A0AA88P7H7_9TELE|nr:hypothetical protein Q8A67_022171 [Cirrhinus molitorella]
MATEGWRPRVSGCCRYPSMPREAMTTTGRRGAAAMETKSVPNIVLVKEQMRVQALGMSEEPAHRYDLTWLTVMSAPNGR